jgi:hypothetical protein
MRALLIPLVLSLSVFANEAAFVSAQFAPPAPGAPPSQVPPQAVPALPPPTVMTPIPVRPLTVDEFVASFKPLPGKYEVLLLHPKTCCPVKVCFTLPPGCIRCVKANSHKIVFDYKCQHDVVIRFLIGGKVWVRG